MRKPENIKKKNRSIPVIEGNNELKLRVRRIIRLLKTEFPEAKTALIFSNPLQLLISTILSAQCTDERVNKVTPLLFRKYKTARDFANANLMELESIIKSTGFYRMKARNIIQTCRLLVNRFNGKVPKNMDDLLSLPGVGRKTANCVLGGAYGIQSGFVVDTHVKRISKRLGLTKNDDPKKIEMDLISIIPRKEWYNMSNLMILHGRKTCRARNPLCDRCILAPLCPSAFSFSKLR